MRKSREPKKRLRHGGTARQHQPAKTKSSGRQHMTTIDYK
jgi:hypothetical protein